MLPEFDTLKYSLPTFCIRINPDRFIKDVDRKGKECYLLKSCEKVVGLNSLRIGAKETVIELSAKILKGNYPNLLSAKTIEEALVNLAAIGAIDFDVHEALNFAHVLKAHQARDFELLQALSEYLKLLYQLHINRDYTPNYHPGETIMYLQNVKTTKHRECYKIYDKALEYGLSKNAAYRETLSTYERQQVAGYFKNKVRAEAQFNSKRKLRQHFPDVDERILLKDLLVSTSDPVSAMFEEITKHIYEQMESTEIIKTLNYITQLDYKGQLIFNSLEKHAFDIIKVNHWLKTTCKTSSLYRYQKEYEAVLMGFRAHHTTGNTQVLLNELKAAIATPPSNAYNYGTIVPKLINQESIATGATENPNNYGTLVPKMIKYENDEQLKKVGYSIEKQQSDDEFWEMIAHNSQPLDTDWLPY